MGNPFDALKPVDHAEPCGGWHVYDGPHDHDPKCFRDPAHATEYAQGLNGPGVLVLPVTTPPAALAEARAALDTVAVSEQHNDPREYLRDAIALLDVEATDRASGYD